MLSETSPDQLTITVKAAAQMLGLSNVTVYKLLDNGDIKSGYTSTGRRLVVMESLREYVANLPTERPSGDAA